MVSEEERLLQIAAYYDRKERLRPRRSASASVADHPDGFWDANARGVTPFGPEQGGVPTRGSREGDGAPVHAPYSTQKGKHSRSLGSRDASDGAYPLRGKERRVTRASSCERGPKRSKTGAKDDEDDDEAPLAQGEKTYRRSGRKREGHADNAVKANGRNNKKNAIHKRKQREGSRSSARVKAIMKRQETEELEREAAAQALLEEKEIEEEEESESEESESEMDMEEDKDEDDLSKLRKNWKFASFCQFCRLFARDLKLPKFAAERLENAILSPEEHTLFLSELLFKLLKERLDTSYTTLDEEKWKVDLPKKLKSRWFRENPEFDNPLLPDVVPESEVPTDASQENDKEDKEEGNVLDVGEGQQEIVHEKTFFSISPGSRMSILYALCEWRMDESLIVREAVDRTTREAERPSSVLRHEPIGTDSKGNSYYYFSNGGEDCRLYKEKADMPTSMKNWRRIHNAQWYTQCVTLDDLIDFARKLARTRSNPERQLFGVLNEEIIPHLEQTRAARKRAEEKQRLYELAVKKRSSRIASIQVAKEEEDKRKQEMERQIELRRQQKELQKREREREKRLEERRLAAEIERERQRQAEVQLKIQQMLYRQERYIHRLRLSSLMREDHRTWEETIEQVEGGSVSWMKGKRSNAYSHCRKIENDWVILHEGNTQYSCDNGKDESTVQMLRSTRCRIPFKPRSADALDTFKRIAAAKELIRFPDLRDNRIVKMRIFNLDKCDESTFVRVRFFYDFKKQHSFEELQEIGLQKGYFKRGTPEIVHKDYLHEIYKDIPVIVKPPLTLEREANDTKQNEVSEPASFDNGNIENAAPANVPLDDSSKDLPKICIKVGVKEANESQKNANANSPQKYMNGFPENGHVQISLK